MAIAFSITSRLSRSSAAFASYNSKKEVSRDDLTSDDMSLEEHTRRFWALETFLAPPSFAGAAAAVGLAAAVGFADV